MSIMRRVIERVAQIVPDRQQDELEHARYLRQPVDRMDGIDKVTGRTIADAFTPKDVR